GSTGEAATLTHDEHIAIVREVVRLVRGRVPVIAGTGSNSTAEAIRLTRAAEEAGADGALLISPYYNKPTQEGIYRHYAAVAEALLAGDLERGRTLMRRLLPLVLATSLEVNPLPVKTALAMMGRCAEEFRLPLTCMSAPARAKLEKVLREYELV